MAIPKSLKPIPKEKAERLIRKHLKAGTGEYEYQDFGDFIFPYRGRWYLLRKDLDSTYEIGRVCL